MKAALNISKLVLESKNFLCDIVCQQLNYSILVKLDIARIKGNEKAVAGILS